MRGRDILGLVWERSGEMWFEMWFDWGSYVCISCDCIGASLSLGAWVLTVVQ